MKKLLSLVLALAMLATVAVSAAGAEELKNLNTYETKPVSWRPGTFIIPRLRLT